MELKDWLNSINLSKDNLLDEDPLAEKDYPPYVINKCMAGHMDTILFANEMNLSHYLDKKLQYDFFINSIKTKKRYSPWLKKDKFDDLEVVKQYYGYSNEKARAALRILTEDQLQHIATKLNQGGKK
ncbi:MAG: DNA polymerase clamp loader subunit A [Flavobacteriaceae bacterium]|jgi:hypothetical protein|tara:strand:- start:223 stop:603 length:381 start_codon:yes stop_codon:yes gene_type:complete